MLVEAFTKDVKGHLVPVWAHYKWYLCANQVYKTSHRIIRSKRNALIFKLIPLSTALSYWTCLNIVGSFGLFEVCKVWRLSRLPDWIRHQKDLWQLCCKALPRLETALSSKSAPSERTKSFGFLDCWFIIKSLWLLTHSPLIDSLTLKLFQIKNSKSVFHTSSPRFHNEERFAQ